MSDVSAGADHPHLPSTSSSVSAASASITRILQHAILQLCNEHVSYDHTLQVLGVVCVTVDDRPSELIVKLNNTLKRVDALATQSDDRRGSAVRAASSRSMSQSWQRGGGAPAGSSEAVSSCSGSAVGPSSEASSGTSRADGQTSDAETSTAVHACSTPVHADNGTSSSSVTPGPVSSESGSRRKCHGRKQSKPVRVQNVVEVDPIDDDDDDEGEIASELGSGILVISPDDLSETPSAANSPISIRASCSERSSPMTPINSTASCHIAAASKRSLAEAFGSVHPSRRTPTPGSTSTVRALLTGMYAKNATVEKQPGLRPSTAESPSLKFVPDLKPDGRLSSLSAGHNASNGIEMHDGSLNFSRYALERPSSDNRIGRSSAEHQSGSSADVKVKEEFLQNPMFPNLDYLMRTPTPATAPNGVGVLPFDISQSLPAFAPFIDESQLMSIARLDPHQFALYSTLFATNGCAQIPGLTLPLNINGINPSVVSSPMNMSQMNPQNGADAPGAPATNRPPSSSSARYTVSSRLNDGLTMHLSRHHPPGRRRERFRRRSGGPGSTSAKVKDIIMYDESSPVQAQRGSRLEGEFMLDALHVDGKKRRRRTAEDTLTPEEIAEYMGSSGEGANAGAGQFACRYCGDVSVDLSRYFAHTLTSHGAYVCHQCGKSFTTKSSLLRHRPIHTGMRRFACSICHKSFYRKDKCKAHIKRHLGIPEGSSNPGGMRPQAVDNTPVIDPALFSAGQLNVAV